jgi:hypothetical protein
MHCALAAAYAAASEPLADSKLQHELQSKKFLPESVVQSQQLANLKERIHLVLPSTTSYMHDAACQAHHLVHASDLDWCSEQVGEEGPLEVSLVEDEAHKANHGNAAQCHLKLQPQDRQAGRRAGNRQIRTGILTPSAWLLPPSTFQRTAGERGSMLQLQPY